MFKKFIASAVFFVVAQSSWGQWSSIPSKDFTISPPPKSGSAIETKDFELLHEFEESRSEEECELARSQRMPSFGGFFGKNDKLVPSDDVEVLKPFMNEIIEFTARVSGYFKTKYKRPRPFVTDPSLKPCAWMPKGATSYPSSHASTAYVTACVLAKIYPARGKAIMAHGQYLGKLRAITGVHHPSDVKAGWEIGKDVCARLLSERDFKEELKSIMGELR